MRKKLLLSLFIAMGLWGVSLGSDAPDFLAAQAIREFVALLNYPNLGIRAAARSALRELTLANPKLVVETLQSIPVFEDQWTQQLMKRAAYLALEKPSPFEELVQLIITSFKSFLSDDAVKDPAYFHFVLRMLENADETNLFVDALARLSTEFQTDEFLTRLSLALREGVWEERLAATLCLLELAPSREAALLEIKKGLTSEDPLIAYPTAKALPKLGEQAVVLVPELLDILAKPQGQWVTPLIRGGLTSLGKPVVPALVEALRHPDKARRKVALELLGALGEAAREAVPAVIEFLRGEYLPELRKAAISTLGAIGRGELSAVLTLERIARRYDPEEISVSLEALVALGPVASEALNTVLLRVHYPIPSVRASALRALRAIAPPEVSVPYLIAALKDANDLVREVAASTLGELGPAAREAILPLLERLHDPAPKVRKAAALAVGRMGQGFPRVVQELIRLLGDEVFEVRLAAVEALGEMGPEAETALFNLLECLVHENKKLSWEQRKELQKAAAGTLGKIGLTPLLDAIITLIPAEERQPLLKWIGEVLTKALESTISERIKSLVDPSAWLLKLLTDVTSIEVYTSVRLALGMQPTYETVVAISPTGRVIFEALRTYANFAELRTAYCLDTAGIRQALGHPHPLGRFLGELIVLGCQPKPHGLRPALVSLVNDEEWTVRLGAWMALLREDEQLERELLEVGLRDEHPAVRSYLIFAASQFLSDPVERKDLLLRALVAEERLVRLSAVLAFFSELGDAREEVVPHLLQWLGTGDRELQYAASAALAYVKAWEALPRILDLAAQNEWDWSFPFTLAWYGEDILPLLQELLASSAPSLRKIAMCIQKMMLTWGKLSPEGLEKACEILLEAINHSDPRVRSEASSNLAMLAIREESYADKVIETLVRALQNEMDQTVRDDMLLHLVWIPKPLLQRKASMLRPVLLELWEKTDPERRLPILLVFRSLGPYAAETIPLLFAELELARYPIDRFIADIALAAGEAAVPYLLEFLEDPAHQLMIVRLLRRMGLEARDALPALLALLQTGNDTIRMEVIEAISALLTGKKE